MVHIAPGEGFDIAEAIGRLRRPLMDLLNAPGLYYFITPAVDRAAVAAVLPLLQQPGVQLRALTVLEPGRLTGDALAALAALRSLPGCEVRGLGHLGARVYLRADGDALVTSAALTAAGLDANLECGLRLDGAAAAALAAEAGRWWEQGEPLTATLWDALDADVRRRRSLRDLSEAVASMGAFVRVSVRGTRRSFRLDPRDFGLEAAPRAVRPVEVSVYVLPEVVRARDDLERVLAEHGVEWSGYYFVPRAFADTDWPRLFAAREQALREWTESAAGRAAIKAMLTRAGQELEAWFAALYEQLAFAGRQPQEPRDAYARVQAMKLLSELDPTAPLENVSLEYRTLHIVPEDPRSLEEVQGLLAHPRFRSLQLTWRL